MAEEQTQHRTTTAGRLRFVLADRSADVALPVEVPLVDLLPAVLTQFGADRVEQGADHEGWVVQRLGEAPLDEDRTMTELGLRDGETIHLRPRADQLAPIDHDDVVDGVAEQVRGHPGAWTPARTRGMLRSGAVLALLLGLPLLLGVGPPAVQAALTGSVALALLAASALVARGAADPVVATILAGVATCYATAAGALAVPALHPPATPVTVLAVAAAGALVALTLGLVLVADAALLFTGATTFAAVVGVAALIGSVTPATPPQAAAIGLTITVLLGVLVPSLAFRLSGLTLPLLPTGAAELDQDIDPVPHRLVVERGVATVGYSSALHLGVGAGQLVLLPLPVLTADAWTTVLVLVVALLLLLRARHPDGRLQRWSVLVPAVAAVVLVLLVHALPLDPLDRLLAGCLPVLAAGVVLLLLSRTMPGRRLRPYWGRAVDVLESLTAVAVLPVLLQVLGVYATMRALAG